MSGNKNIRLLRRPHPLAGESIMGYLTRAAFENGFVSSDTLLHIGQSDTYLPFRHCNITGLAHLMGILPQQISSRCYWPGSEVASSLRYNGSPVKRWMLNLLRPRLCPHCIREKNIHLADWDLAIVACCPAHGIKLLDHCPDCGAGIDWPHAAFGRCAKCGFDYRYTFVSQAPEPALQLTEYILSKTRGVSEPKRQFSSLHGSSLSSVIELTMFLGAHALNRGLGSGCWMSARLSASAMVRMVDAAAEILTDWPLRFYMLVEAIRASNAQLADKTGVGHEFGAFYETLTKCLNGADFDFIREEMRFYIQHQWNGGFISRKNRRLNLAGREHDVFVTRAAAARLLKIRPTTVSKRLGANKLKGLTRQMGSRTLTLIEKPSLLQCAAIDKDMITFKEARSILGVSERGFRSLLTCGLVNPIEEKIPQPQYRWSFSKKQVTKFLEQIYIGIPQFKGKTKAKLSSFDMTLRTLTSLGLTMGDLVQLIFANSLIVRMRDCQNTGLKQCIFDMADVEAFVAKNSLVGSDFVTLPTVASSLKLKEQVVYDLANRRILPTRLREKRGRTFQAVHVRDLCKFTERYVSGSALAEKLKTSPRSAMQQLARENINPVTGPTVDGGRQYFYRVEQVKEITSKM